MALIGGLFSNFCCKLATFDSCRAAILAPVGITLVPAPASETALAILALTGGFSPGFFSPVFKLTLLFIFGTVFGNTAGFDADTVGFFTTPALLFKTSGDLLLPVFGEQLVTRSGLLEVADFGEGGAGRVGEGFLVRKLGGVICLLIVFVEGLFAVLGLAGVVLGLVKVGVLTFEEVLLSFVICFLEFTGLILVFVVVSEAGLVCLVVSGSGLDLKVLIGAFWGTDGRFSGLEVKFFAGGFTKFGLIYPLDVELALDFTFPILL